MSATEDHRFVAPIVGPDDPRHFTDSGIEIQPLYTEDDVPEQLELGEPGAFPYTRGVHRDMYRKQLWTMRQYAGYASAKESNERYKYLLAHGSTGLSMAFDLPTQLGLDSDDPRCLGEVGRTGVAIDTIDDMRTAFDGIPLDQVSTSMTINAPAAVLLLLYQLVGEEQGVAPEKLRGTTQNDIIKEYVARGNFIYPPEGSMRLTTDLFAYCKETVPRWNTVSISGYHFREKGCSAVQEVAFTLSSGIAYVQAAVDAGLAVDDFAPRLAFFFNGHNNVFQEVAKFRAARKMWAQIMRERFGAQDEKSLKLRFHTQTGGVTLTAQQPENNIVRVALQGFAAVCGGTQSLHTNGFDEALALPTERAAKIALRTQQIIGHESGAADTVDPFAGSYFVEALTAEIEQRAGELIAKVDELGGSVNAIAFIKNEIEESAWGYQERYKQEQDIVVGVNKYVDEALEVPDLLRVDPQSEREQVERLKAFKANRDQALVDTAPGGAARGRARQREPAAADPPGAQGPRLDGRGLRRDARRVRQIPAGHLSRSSELRRLRSWHPGTPPVATHGGEVDAIRSRAPPGRPRRRAAAVPRRTRRCCTDQSHCDARTAARPAAGRRRLGRRSAPGLPARDGLRRQRLGRQRQDVRHPLRAGHRLLRQPRRRLHDGAVRDRRQGERVELPRRLARRLRRHHGDDHGRRPSRAGDAERRHLQPRAAGRIARRARHRQPAARRRAVAEPREAARDGHGRPARPRAHRAHPRRAEHGGRPAGAHRQTRPDAVRLRERQIVLHQPDLVHPRAGDAHLDGARRRRSRARRTPTRRPTAGTSRSTRS